MISVNEMDPSSFTCFIPFITNCVYLLLPKDIELINVFLYLSSSHCVYLISLMCEKSTFCFNS